MTVVCHLIPVDRLASFAFDDPARSVGRAGYLVAYASDGNAAYGKVGGSDADDAATVGCHVVQSYDVWHRCTSVRIPLYQRVHNLSVSMLL